jgi:hypothetical protein
MVYNGSPPPTKMCDGVKRMRRVAPFVVPKDLLSPLAFR